jgi:peptide/nickel transport system ATP-binding protein
MYYHLGEGYVKAVDDVSFYLNEGEILGIVGESGCGKSSLGKTILRVLPSNGKIVHGQISYLGKDIITLDEEEFNKLRWKDISMIFQAAMNSLDPAYKIGDQLIEVLRVHDKQISKLDARRRVKEVFEIVGLSPSEMNDYPHELSGGMKQRAIIAMSMLYNPKIIIADEPTTALDVVVQDQILQEMKEIQRQFRMSMMFITHNIAVIAENSDRIAIMYGGKIVETGKKNEIFENACHPYTFGLFQSIPSIYGPKKDLFSMKGSPVNLLSPPSGCRFQERCPFRKEICSQEEPTEKKVSAYHSYECHFRFAKEDFSSDIWKR